MSRILAKWIRASRNNLKSKFCCALVLLALAGGATQAEEPYPARPIRLVVGFGAGGPTDIPARFIAEKLGEALGQRVIVENKPAAAGMIATRDALAQPRDGYTLLLCTHFEPINTALYKNAQFKLSDIAPVSLIAKYYYGLALANAVPAADFGAFVGYAKAHPGEVSYATIGAGSAQEILARQLEKLTGISMNRVPFRGGAQVVQELIAGRVQFYLADAGDRAAIPSRTAQDSGGDGTAAVEELVRDPPRSPSAGSITCASAGSESAPAPARRSRSSICCSASLRRSSARMTTAR